MTERKIYPLPYLARIFRAMRGDQAEQKIVTIAEVEQFQPAETFSEFLEINQLPVFEEILR